MQALLVPAQARVVDVGVEGRLHRVEVEQIADLRRVGVIKYIFRQWLVEIQYFHALN